MTFCCSMYIFTMDGADANISPLPLYAAYGAPKAGVILPHLCMRSCQNCITCPCRSPVVHTASKIMSCLLDHCYGTVRTGRGRLRYLLQHLCACSNYGPLCASRSCGLTALKEFRLHQAPDSMDSMVPIAGVQG